MPPKDSRCKQMYLKIHYRSVDLAHDTSSVNGNSLCHVILKSFDKRFSFRAHTTTTVYMYKTFFCRSLNPIGDLERPGSHAGEQFCKIFLKSINLKPRYNPDTKVGQTLKDAQKSQLQYLKWNFIAIYQAICWLRYCITWVEKGACLNVLDKTPTICISCQGE